MYNYRKFQLDVLTQALREFESKNTYNLPEDILDSIWSVQIKALDNSRVSRFFGRYYPRDKVIEMVPSMFKSNLLAYKDTVIHELAHHITDLLWPNASNAHGAEWKSVCVILGCEPKKSKNLDNFRLEWNQSKNNGYFKGYEL